ncbi:MAG: hypothetical protein QW367_01885 [Candidatus Aenigmatarchaeota archaeon]
MIEIIRTEGSPSPEQPKFSCGYCLQNFDDPFSLWFHWEGECKNAKEMRIFLKDIQEEIRKTLRELVEKKEENLKSRLIMAVIRIIEKLSTNYKNELIKIVEIINNLRDEKETRQKFFETLIKSGLVLKIKDEKEDLHYVYWGQIVEHTDMGTAIYEEIFVEDEMGVYMSYPIRKDLNSIYCFRCKTHVNIEIEDSNYNFLLLLTYLPRFINKLNLLKRVTAKEIKELMEVANKYLNDLSKISAENKESEEPLKDFIEEITNAYLEFTKNLSPTEDSIFKFLLKHGVRFFIWNILISKINDEKLLFCLREIIKNKLKEKGKSVESFDILDIPGLIFERISERAERMVVCENCFARHIIINGALIDECRFYFTFIDHKYRSFNCHICGENLIV